VERQGHRAAGAEATAGTAVTLPWFRQRPGLTVAVAAVLYAAVLALQWTVVGPEPITLLFCFPIALLAVAFGLRVGLLAGATGILLVLMWVVTQDAELSFLGWVSRVAPMVLLGGLLGDAADRLHRSETERIELRTAAQRHFDAIELQDGVLQQISAAKWALEAGRTELGLEIVTTTLDATQGLISDMLRDADGAAGGRPARRSASGPPALLPRVKGS
jgi:hypothetical protein